MKTSTVFYFFSLANFAMAAPIKQKAPEPDQSPNPQRMPNWFLNCTGGWVEWCRERGTYCNNAWAMSNDNWCYNNCQCEYWDGCSDFCLTGGTEDQDGQEAANEEVAAKVAPEGI
ncbi:uncharacterized protein FTOL_12777 [Fusarium torulosum]|uniref:ShKT domain-containing protein n=1 Tax=Fusarium torulosum TaxID=33205 RepID=A0AAE8ML19_9HYPO|nr:uncharacterized protein FTOL_12777 [Fusarium torulosum]